MDAISHRTPKIEHDFAITAWACSVRTDIVEDAKSRLVGNAAARTAIERCVRKLLSNDVDAVADGKIDQMIDTFWDELKHFQNRSVLHCTTIVCCKYKSHTSLIISQYWSV